MQSGTQTKHFNATKKVIFSFCYKEYFAINATNFWDNVKECDQVSLG